jgi:hypothetical protein
MTRIDKVLKELSELYKFNRNIKAYDLNKQPETLREQIKQGVLKRAERDLKISQEWNSLEDSLG